ncbi:MAG: TonB-dependent receptor [Treponema sp.]|jgi:outer membrane receptor for ferrienterochelin and colicins|nr:TonB-dependent receptor [Treponema sp.]
MFKRLLIVTCCAFLCTTIVAQEDTPVLVVTGGKIAQDVNETVEAVEVVSAEDIADMGAKNVAEVLENVAGLVIFDHPQATVMMQGFGGAYVKVLIDGLEIAGDTGGATQLNLIPVADVERIEIVRGASSALYGSDALGGVINIITKKPEADKFSLKTTHEIASNLRYYGELSAGYANKQFALSGAGSFDYDGGKERTERVGSKSLSLYDMPYSRLGSARLNGSMFWGGGELDLYAAWSDSVLKVSANTESGYDFMNQRLEGGATIKHQLGETLGLEGYVKYDRLDYDATRYAYMWDTSSSYADSVFQNIEGEARLAWEPSIEHSLLFGLNTANESLDSDTFLDAKLSAVIGAFVQDIWNIGGMDKYRLTPGLRVDVPLPQSGSAASPSITPKLAFRFDPSEKLILRASYGMGFKSPTLKQRYWVFFHPSPYNFLIEGNPELKPESSHGFNVSADYTVFDGFSASISGYYNYVFDMIEAQQVAGSTEGSAIGADGLEHNYIYIMRYRNIGKVMTAGGDLSLRWKQERVAAAFTYSYGLAKEWNEEKEGYIDMVSRVPQQITASVLYTVPFIGTDFSLRLNWSAPQLVSVEENTYSPDYFMVNLRVAKTFFDKHLEVYCGAKNLLDNFNFIEGSAGETQRDYFGLRDGIIFYLGGTFKL